MLNNIFKTTLIATTMNVLMVNGCDIHDRNACEVTCHRYQGQMIDCLNGNPDQKLTTCRCTRNVDANSATVYFAELLDKSFNTYCLKEDYADLLACDTYDACKC